MRFTRIRVSSALSRTAFTYYYHLVSTLLLVTSCEMFIKPYFNYLKLFNVTLVPIHESVLVLCGIRGMQSTSEFKNLKDEASLVCHTFENHE